MDNPNNIVIATLRRDLHFTIQEGQGDSYVLEDPLRQKFYRIGREEYVFLTELDGKSTLEQVVHRANGLLSDEIFDEQNSQIILQWLLQNQLLSNSSEELVKGRIFSDEQIKKQKLFSKLNLISIKIPLFNPDKIFEVVSPWLNWMTGPYFSLLWGITLVSSIVVLNQNFTHFFQTATTALSPGNMLFLWLAWFVLKILHETSHALTCYRYHGRVFEAGILFIVFFPLTYINASSTWAFPRRWQRIHAAFAGIYAELFIAAIAILIWADTPGSIIGTISHNLVLVAGFSSLLFNANPLMRFDGYFILSDAIGVPNLYGRGKEFVASIFSYIFFGQWSYVKRFTLNKELFIAFYGFAAWGWRIFILLFLLLLVASSVHGFGIFIAILSSVLLVGIPLWKLKDTIRTLYMENLPVFKRFLMSTFCCCLGVLLLLNLLHWERNITVPAVVQYESELSIKAKVSGIVEEIFVASGEAVAKGAPLIKLYNPDLSAQLRQLEVESALLSLKKRTSLINEELTTYQVLEKQTVVIGERIQSLKEDLAALVIRAESNGIVLARKLQQRRGTHISKGKEILLLVSENKKKLLASVEQDEISAFRNLQSKSLIVIKRSMDRSSFPATVGHISPKAETAIPDNALSAAFGGPVAVRQSHLPAVGSGSTQTPGYEFFSPRFAVEITIPAEEANILQVGQLVTVQVAGQSVSLWDFVKKKLTQYFSSRLSTRAASN